MSDLLNSVFISDNSGNLTVYDINNGSTLMNYKCGVLHPRCFSILKNDFIFGAEKGPVIHVWQINNQEKLNSVRLVCPGIINCLNVSPDNCYIAVTSEEKIYIWQICSGKLLCTARRHYQAITVLQWTRDSCYVITGGNDGLVCVWKLSDLVTGSCWYDDSNKYNISYKHDGEVKPKLVFDDHSVKITDIYVGNGDYKARIFTVSFDKTCRMYDLLSGRQMLCVIFDDQLTSVTSDPLETNVFVGTTNGSINCFSLLDPPRNLESHFKNTAGDNNKSTFVGHNDNINYLQCTTDGSLLISASNDKTVKVWHLHSGQCIRTLTLKGQVTNMAIRLLEKNVMSQKFTSNIIVKSFQKSYDSEGADVLEIMTLDDAFSSDEHETDTLPTVYDDEVHRLRSDVTTLKSVNKQLYEYALENVFENYEEPRPLKILYSVTKDDLTRESQIGEMKLLKKVKKRKKLRNKKKRKANNYPDFNKSDDD